MAVSQLKYKAMELTMNENASPRKLAQHGVINLKLAVLKLLCEQGAAMSNADIGKRLGIVSDYEGHHKHYFSWSLLGMMLKDGTVRKKGKVYEITDAGREAINSRM